MYVASIPNRNSPPAILLREGYREGGKVKTRTLANLSHWPPEQVEALRQVLRGGRVGRPLAEAFQVVRSRPHGHVAATLGTLRRLGLERIIDSRRSRGRDLAVAMVVARLLDPRSKLATARGLSADTLESSLGEVLGVSSADEDDLYAAMDWLGSRQARIEAALARRHLDEGTLVLYDVSSAAFEGRHCPLAQLGYPRDGVWGRPQIVFGLLTTQEGCPVAVEVFEGSTADPKTLPCQIDKLRARFGLVRVVLVGDRGMLTEARLREDLRPTKGLEWITALRSPAISKLARSGHLQLSLFDQRDLAEITHPEYPGERLVVCRNPLLAEERARKRQDLLASTEAELSKIRAATQRKSRALRGQDQIGLRVGRVVNRYKVGKHFVLEIGEESFSFRRDEERIASEAALDGIYVLRTSLGAEHLPAPQVVRAYKGLAQVERAFRCYNMDLLVRPIHHRKPERVRAHLFICMLAYYVEWHMRGALAPLLFADDDRASAESARPSPVAPAQRSPRARRKAARKRTDQGAPVHSFGTLLRDLATVVVGRIQPADPSIPAFDKITTPTPLQQRAFDLLGVSPRLGIP
ncbi:MAG: IS1634 family transposase [Acidimicrobiia bacterium]